MSDPELSNTKNIIELNTTAINNTSLGTQSITEQANVPIKTYQVSYYPFGPNGIIKQGQIYQYNSPFGPNGIIKYSNVSDQNSSCENKNQMKN